MSVPALDPKKLKESLNLPDPDFTIPMKADLAKREPEIQAKWREIDIYARIQEARRNAEPYILHDGPPYTNSPIHMGTAMNKILKDFVVKSHTLMGYRCPYVPGFDNHGLPIEMAVTRKLEAEKRKLDIVAFRQACRDHATHYIGIQSEQFQRLGVFGLWGEAYNTLDARYEAELVRIFGRLVERGYVYRGLRPVLWSPTSRTALADTEIVYQDHVSRSIFVRFPLSEDPKGLFEGLSDVAAVIWTTTPWTIPANLAVAFHPDLDYAVVRTERGHLVLFEGLVERTMGKVGLSDFEVVRKFKGKELERTIFRHPVFDRASLAVLAPYVTTEDGTGVVHTAPGHGREDFATGQKYGLPVLCPVDAGGVLTEEAGEFAGIYYKKCDEAVTQRLRELGMLLFDEPYPHSYPYAERDGQPVIFRATEQWFIAIDHDSLRARMLGEIDQVQWVPENGRARITSMVANRPDWCISRQRPWGVGIPVFYGDESGEPVLDPVAIEAVAKFVEREGGDAWFAAPPESILPEGYKHPQTGETVFRKETDVLDVWFDSGATALCVLEGHVNPNWADRWPADTYLEGSDQHRGWFNVSLIIGTALKGSAPYRNVLTHGYVLDDAKQKMSKRSGNAVDPVEASENYGADILRYWASSVDYTNDVSMSPALLTTAGDRYRRVRNTLRFLLANLADYSPEWNGQLLPVDRWIVEQTELIVDICLRCYRQFDFRQVEYELNYFCTEELSAFYLSVIKDRMYCDGADWPSRRSAQAASHAVLLRLTKLIAPVLAHTAEEVYARIPGIERLASVHMETLRPLSATELEAIRESDLHRDLATLLKIRAEVFATFEEWKKAAESKDPQDAVAVVTLPEPGPLLSFEADLPILFGMSEVRVDRGEVRYTFEPSPYLKCERSRLRRPDVSLVDGVPLSLRDRTVLGLA